LNDNKLDIGIAINILKHLYDLDNIRTKYTTLRSWNHIVQYTISMLDPIALDRTFGSRSGKPTNYKISICCFSAIFWNGVQLCKENYWRVA